ncbi:hypothetical protein ABIF63_004807 [Bradyrhizobium japonicum]|uniref:Uncharacterized protein n=1 Tax=Bradyrhizobium japonicum TaxID=375 RepID=A0ABV2RUV3_BRAJP|nr:hypothetical protein [Bradyrhizobium japonicum]UQD96054.1 hypothetical protein JEY30_31425 [Bradyrhizobium japonicum]WLB16208.1 hypothetical protein QIH95_29705 [Bradyrhizobium japonicum]
MAIIARFGNTAVPYTVSWTGEERQFVGGCPHARAPALRMHSAPGVGKPQFGKPHSDRQREAIARGLCDLCGKPLKNRTKVSLSHARDRTNAAHGSTTGILQVEPLLHRECALESIKFCPSLKRDIAAGSLMIRQVNRYAVQFAIMAPEYIQHYVPDYQPSAKDRIVGHAKVELIRWIDRDLDWLGQAQKAGDDRGQTELADAGTPQEGVSVGS